MAETKIAQGAFEKQQLEKKPEVNLTRQTAARGTPDPKAEAWSEKTHGLVRIHAMTYTAFDLT